MKPGPRPTPTAILNLTGSWRAKQRRGEPQPPKTRPTCPGWLSAEAKQKWRTVVKDLESMNVLTRVDADVTARYADTWVWRKRCRDFIEKHGESYPVYDQDGNLLRHQQYPQVGLCLKLSEQLARMEEALGLNPSGRTRLQVTAPRQPPPVASRPRPQTVQFFSAVDGRGMN
jgi:P27 family predicted phage terminase small subunit